MKNKTDRVELIGKYQLKARIKSFLPEGTLLDMEAVEVMQGTLNGIFSSVMKGVSEKPFRQYTGYIVSKECQKFLVQGESLQHTVRLMGEMRARIDEWFERLKEGKIQEHE